MGVHVAGTQHGHTYYLGPLEGTRAPALIALRSRAPAARIQFWPLQHTIWQIEGGLAYNDMTPESRALIDQLIPEYRNQLRENFVRSMQKACGGGILGKLSPGLCTDINILMAQYQQTQATLKRYENNYQALAQQIVHVIPGNYPNPGPEYWSRLNPRVYARVTGGHIWQETSNLEIRVLPSSGATSPIASRRSGPVLRNVSYSLTGPSEFAQITSNDAADVPLGGAIIYPDVGAGVQVLGPEVVLGGGSGPVITSVDPILAEANPTIHVTGHGFGSLPLEYQTPWPYKGDTPYFEFLDSTRDWRAGYRAKGSLVGDVCDATISEWTDTEIRIVVNVNGPFSSLPIAGCALRPADKLSITLRSPQSNAEQSVSTSASATAYGFPKQLSCQPLRETQTGTQSLLCGTPGPNVSLNDIAVTVDVAMICHFFEGLLQEAGGNSEDFGVGDKWLMTSYSNQPSSISPKAVCDASDSAIISLLIQTTESSSRAQSNAKTLCFVPRWGGGSKLECVPLAENQAPRMPSEAPQSSTSSASEGTSAPMPPTVSQSDQTIVSDINAKVWQDSVLKTFDIRVSSQNGVVTLTGTVNTELEKAAVERIARAENGVTQVINQLLVSPTPQ